MIVDGALDQLEAAYRALNADKALNADRGSIFTLPDAQIKDVICSAYKSRLTEFISDVIDTAASEVEPTDFDWEAVFALPNEPLVYDKIKNYRKFTASCVVIERSHPDYDRPEQCIVSLSPGSLLARLVLRKHLSRVELNQKGQILKIISGESSEDLLMLMRPPEDMATEASEKALDDSPCAIIDHELAADIEDADVYVAKFQSLVDDLLDVIEEKYDATLTDAQRPYCGLKSVGYPNP
jgi:hypothetical protein